MLVDFNKRQEMSFVRPIQLQQYICLHMEVTERCTSEVYSNSKNMVLSITGSVKVFFHHFRVMTKHYHERGDV